MRTVIFTIEFRGPFAVATGAASGGLDATVDRECPLPGSSLKGLMRAQARAVLKLPTSTVEAVFGSTRIESPWAWSDAVPEAEWHFERHTRIEIGQNGIAKDGAIRFGEHVWASTATFTIDQYGAVEDPLSHELVLRASARSVSALGGARRRGGGWVTISDGPWTDENHAALAALSQSTRSPEES